MDSFPADYTRHTQTRRSIARALACILVTIVAGVIATAGEGIAGSGDALAWPAISQTARPWTRWWWHGSAVDRANITRLLQTYHDAGIGGVEITCIYGVRGEEAHDRAYLSDAWIEAVSQVVDEARHLEMGVDLPPGSGWRMGGPSVSAADADSKLVLKGDPLTVTEMWAGDGVKRAAPGGEGRSINPYSSAR